MKIPALPATHHHHLLHSARTRTHRLLVLCCAVLCCAACRSRACGGCMPAPPCPSRWILRGQSTTGRWPTGRAQVRAPPAAFLSVCVFAGSGAREGREQCPRAVGPTANCACAGTVPSQCFAVMSTKQNAYPAPLSACMQRARQRGPAAANSWRPARAARLAAACCPCGLPTCCWRSRRRRGCCQLAPGCLPWCWVTWGPCQCPRCPHPLPFPDTALVRPLPFTACTPRPLQSVVLP